MELLQRAPGDFAARYALAICLTDLARFPEARVQFRRVLDDDPRHHQAAYRLGRLLQADSDAEGAADAYRRVLSLVPDFRDTAARLAACEGAVAAPTRAPSPLPPAGGAPLTGRPLVPGPPTLRSRSDTHRVADRGAEKVSVRLKPRHLVPVTVGRALLATFAALIAASALMVDQVALVILAVLLFLLPWYVGLAVGTAGVAAMATGAIGGGVLRAVLFVLPLPLALAVVVGIPVILVTSRTNSATFYEYGVDVKAGFVRRRVQFIWYYQIVESPSYVRTFGSYFTCTASLGLRYNDTGAFSARYVELPGIGSPRKVGDIGRYVESRVFPERCPVRGPWT
jgi:hypothetical protein